ncbi:hypothetical protein [Pandoravirus japonicus]|uniref:Transmembrane protein n=1 Tax=Pandoravirus japonicus TaxID=2823154 RepID=A0A811BQQ2_9VIRU|nr:hypothetical protein [Pandoravirus japonicus]
MGGRACAPEERSRAEGRAWSDRAPRRRRLQTRTRCEHTGRPRRPGRRIPSLSRVFFPCARCIFREVARLPGSFSFFFFFFLTVSLLFSSRPLFPFLSPRTLTSSFFCFFFSPFCARRLLDGKKTP